MSEVTIGNGGLGMVALRHESGASAEIYLWGATLTSYKRPGGLESIFVSPGAIFDGKKAIRGGVPLVFPQFGQPDTSMPQHGLARTSEWKVGDISDSSQESTVVLTLQSSDATMEKWPHAFLLEYQVTITGLALTMKLTIRNTDSKSFDFQALLHTYFNIPDIGEVAVLGLGGRRYVDKVAGGEVKEETQDQIVLPSFTDRIYLGTEEAGSTGEKAVRITKGDGGIFAVMNKAATELGPAPVDVVVWNPYEVASPGDLPVPAYKNFVCVEPGMVGRMYTLEANHCAHVMQKIVCALPDETVDATL